MTKPMYVLGGWQSDFAEKAASGALYDLLKPAALGAIEDAAIEPREVDVIHVGNFVSEIFTGQGQLGGLVASVNPDLANKPASRHGAACASGSMAVLAAMADIESGRYDCALVIGAEVLRNVLGKEAGLRLGSAAWVGKEVVDEPHPWPSMFAHR